MSTFKLGRNPVAFRKVVVWSASTDAALSTSPTITSGSAAPSANEPVGSLYLRTGGSSFESIVYVKTASGAGAGNWEVAGAVGSFTDLAVTVNSDAAAGTEEDPSLVLKGGDGGTEVVVATLKQDSSADLLWYEQAGGAAGTTRKSPNLNIGRPGETTVSLDSIITFNAATDAGAAKVGAITYQGQEINLKLDPGTGGTIQMADKVIHTADEYVFTGSNFDLDPTGNFTLDMDSGFTARILLDSNIANSFVIESGSDDMFVINTNSDELVFGNSATNPAYSFLGSSSASFSGGVSTNTLTERTADSGIAIPAGVEILGVPKVESAAITYNQADGALWTVPAGQVWLIDRVWFQTNTDWDGDGAFIVGVTGDADGFLTMANSSLDPAHDESGGATGWPTGSRGLDAVNRGPLLSTPTTGYPRAYRAVAGTTILIDNTPGTSTQGAGTLFMQYTRLL